MTKEQEEQLLDVIAEEAATLMGEASDLARRMPDLTQKDGERLSEIKGEMRAYNNILAKFIEFGD